MIIGTLMALETCQIHDVSHNLLYSTKKLLTDIYVVRGEINEETAYIQARSFMARAMEVNGEACEAEGKTKVVRSKNSS